MITLLSVIVVMLLAFLYFYACHIIETKYILCELGVHKPTTNIRWIGSKFVAECARCKVAMEQDRYGNWDVKKTSTSKITC